MDDSGRTPTVCVYTDPDILAELETYKAPLQTFKARDIGKTSVLLEGDDTCRERECSLGQCPGYVYCGRSYTVLELD